MRTCFETLKQQGYRYAVVDAVDNAQLEVLAEAVADFKLVTGGSGLGAYMAARRSGGRQRHKAFVPPKGKTVVLSGSCSLMTNRQVEHYKHKAPHYFLDVEQALGNAEYVEELYQWVCQNLGGNFAPMVYATVSPETLNAIQTKLGVSRASMAVEHTFAALAKKLRQVGITHFITAGGETSSIVVQQLGLSGFHIGKQIAPGVPWLQAVEKPIFLALKSGNFGQEDFFSFAQEMFV